MDPKSVAEKPRFKKIFGKARPTSCLGSIWLMDIQTLSMSVIVPAFNAERVLPQCLKALNGSACKPCEILVVNDGSTDRTAEIATAYGATILNTSRPQSGPGAARNQAARVAAGDILMFVDADVVVERETLGLMHQHFASDPEIAAVFGSYDSEPAQANFFSQYKNLQHHYVHQTGRRDAQTFWAGCGAIRKQKFLEVGGFDVQNYPRPSIEDIELGYRLRAAGYSIRLDPAIQAKHLKRWTPWQWLSTDIFCRAVPWSRLILSRPDIPLELNTSRSERINAVLAWTIVGFLPFCFLQPWLVTVPIAAFLAVLYSNRGFYGFLSRHRGFGFLLRTWPVHIFYYLYSSISFASCWFEHKWGRGSGREPAT